MSQRTRHKPSETITGKLPSCSRRQPSSQFCTTFIHNRTSTELTARQHNDPRPRSAVSEHLSEGLLLVGPQHGHRLQVDVDVRVDGVVAEVVLGQQRVFQLDTPLLDYLNTVLTGGGGAEVVRPICGGLLCVKFGHV